MKQSPSGETSARGVPEERHMQGHWLLAKLGKRVLRPGGIGLTRQLLTAAAPVVGDRIVEFGPGVGMTTQILLDKGPQAYTAVDPNPEGQEAVKRVIAPHPQASLVVADAADTGLPDGQADLVIGEAMLSMHGRAEKAAIVAEAARLLAPGGRYAIHELLRVQTDNDAEAGADVDSIGTPRDAVSKDISRAITVGARPLTIEGWSDLLAEHDLHVEWVGQAPMRLLEPRRIIADEGFLRALKFFANVARNKPARQRVLAMRATFRANATKLGAIAIVARRAHEPGESS